MRHGDYFALEPYKGDRLADLLTFLQLLLPLSGESHLDRFTIKPTRGSPGSDAGPAKLIEEWTGGILKHIMILLVDATERAIEENLPCLDAQLLERTWADIQTAGIDKLDA